MGSAAAAKTAATGQPLEGGVDPQRIRQIAPMLGAQPFAFGPKIDDRAGWQRNGDRDGDDGWRQRRLAFIYVRADADGRQSFAAGSYGW